MAIMGRDRVLRLFYFPTGKIVWKIDESLQVNMLRQTKPNPTKEEAMLRMEGISFERKIAIEKDIMKSSFALGKMDLQFNDQDSLLVYPSLIGIKVVDIQTKTVPTLTYI